MALIVIDMQPDFKAANKREVIEATAKQVEKSRRRGELILLVEYEGHEPTHKRIRDLIEGYQYGHTIYKSGDDGALEILDYLFEINCKPKKFKVCGVNAAHCLRSTVETLAKLQPHSEIVLFRDCINCVRRSINLEWSNVLSNVRILECQLIA